VSHSATISSAVTANCSKALHSMLFYQQSSDALLSSTVPTIRRALDTWLVLWDKHVEIGQVGNPEVGHLGVGPWHGGFTRHAREFQVLGIARLDDALNRCRIPEANKEQRITTWCDEASMTRVTNLMLAFKDICHKDFGS
jgi:hypothetical protein